MFGTNQELIATDLDRYMTGTENVFDINSSMIQSLHSPQTGYAQRLWLFDPALLTIALRTEDVPKADSLCRLISRVRSRIIRGYPRRSWRDRGKSIFHEHTCLRGKAIITALTPFHGSQRLRLHPTRNIQSIALFTSFCRTYCLEFEFCRH